MLLFKINSYVNKSDTFYGIDILKSEHLIRQYVNISQKSDEIIKLVELCNSLDIEECHIDDIIDDFLTDFKAY